MLGLWAVALLATLEIYRKSEVIVPILSRRSKSLAFSRRFEGFETQGIIAIFLVIGFFVFLGTLLWEFHRSAAGGSRYSSGRKLGLKQRVARWKRRTLLKRTLCPACGSTEVHPSRRRTLDYIAAIFLTAPYRCHRCHCRFYRLFFLTRV